MEDSVFSYLGDLTVGEGEEHVGEALTQEAAGLGVGQGTDDRVPGRLLGRQAEYEKIGAEPYIFRSEFLVSFGVSKPFLNFSSNTKCATFLPLLFVCSHLGWVQAGVRLQAALLHAGQQQVGQREARLRGGRAGEAREARLHRQGRQ